jgi:hypothetical protein
MSRIFVQRRASRRASRPALKKGEDHMGTKRIAILTSCSLMLIAGWMPPAVVTTAAVGTAVVAGVGCSSKSSTRQDTRTEQRTEERMENRRD